MSKALLGPLDPGVNVGGVQFNQVTIRDIAYNPSSRLDFCREQTDTQTNIALYILYCVEKRLIINKKETGFGTLKIFIRLFSSRGSAIAQWICLCLPFCGPGFKSQSNHLCFIIWSKICAIFVV